MPKYANLTCLALALLVFAVPARAEDLSAEDRAKVDAAVKKLDTTDAGQRAAAEAELRAVGPKSVPALTGAKVANEEGHARLRTVLTDFAVEKAKIDPTDANLLMQIAKEEALAKRYGNAAKCYTRAEKLYEKLKDDADDKKDKAKEDEYAALESKADRLKDKANDLAKGREHKPGMWGPLPTIKEVKDDGDW